MRLTKKGERLRVQLGLVALELGRHCWTQGVHATLDQEQMELTETLRNRQKWS